MTPIGVPGAPSPPTIMRNLTTQKYTLQIPAGQAETVTYAFATEMHPQDLTLNLAAVFQDKAGKIYTSNFYNETVSVAEAPVSIFDPQMYVSTPCAAEQFMLTCLASSSTSSLPVSLAVPVTSSTTHGLPLCSRRSDVEARAVSEQSDPQQVPRRSTPPTKSASLVPTDQPLRVVLRLTTKAGSPLTT